jgi:hypothetical protein
MRRHIPGLHSGHHRVSSNLDGLFLVVPPIGGIPRNLSWRYASASWNQRPSRLSLLVASKKIEVPSPDLCRMTSRSSDGETTVEHHLR